MSALSWDCGYCGAIPGRACVSTQGRPRGTLRGAHATRRALAERMRPTAPDAQPAPPKIVGRLMAIIEGGVIVWAHPNLFATTGGSK